MENPCFFLQSSWSGPAHWPTSDRGKPKMSSRPRPFTAARRDLIQSRIQIHQAEGNLYLSSRPRPFMAAWRDLKPYLLRSSHSGFILLISISFLLLLHLLSCFSLAIAFLISWQLSHHTSLCTLYFSVNPVSMPVLCSYTLLDRLFVTPMYKAWLLLLAIM